MLFLIRVFSNKSSVSRVSQLTFELGSNCCKICVRANVLSRNSSLNIVHSSTLIHEENDFVSIALVLRHQYNFVDCRQTSWNELFHCCIQKCTKAGIKPSTVPQIKRCTILQNLSFQLLQLVNNCQSYHKNQSGNHSKGPKSVKLVRFLLLSTKLCRLDSCRFVKNDCIDANERSCKPTVRSNMHFMSTFTVKTTSTLHHHNSLCSY